MIAALVVSVAWALAATVAAGVLLVRFVGYIERQDERFDRLLHRLGQNQADAVERAMFGGPKVEARVEQRERDAVAEAGRAVSEDTIARGMAAMRVEYRRMGVEKSDDELREEVLLLANGVPIAP